jgi:hypothetical protein
MIESAKARYKTKIPITKQTFIKRMRSAVMPGLLLSILGAGDAVYGSPPGKGMYLCINHATS